MSVPTLLETTQAELSAENEATLRQLVRTIDYAEGLTLLFARCNIPTLRRVLAGEAMRRLEAKNIAVVEIEFEEATSDLRRHLRERLADSPVPRRKTAVFLYGLEHAIPSQEPDVPLLTELNMGRELFHQDAPHPLVFWLPDYALTALARGAPDFWAWRSGVFEFETERAYREEALQVYAREGADWLIIDNLTAEQKRRRRTVLENLLKDYEDLEEDRRTLSERSEVVFTLGQLNEALGEFQEARRLYQQSLAIKEKLGDQAGIARSLGQLGVIAQEQGEYAEARRLYQQSLEIKEKLGDQAGIASSLHNLGMIAQDQGEYAEARRLYQQSLETFERLKSPYAETVRRSLGRLEEETRGSNRT